MDRKGVKGAAKYAYQMEVSRKVSKLGTDG